VKPIQRLKIKRLNALEKRLQALETDHEAISEELTYTSNRGEQERLKRQLAAIEQQYELVAEEYEALEAEVQDLGLNRTEAVTSQAEELTSEDPSLLDLLRPLETELLELLREAYRFCRPEDWSNAFPTNLAGIVRDLAQMMPDPEGRDPYSKFIAFLLATPDLPSNLRISLQTWAEQRDEHFQDLIEGIRKERQAAPSSESMEPYLMVLVRRSNDASSRSQEADDQYFVDAWIIEDSSTYDPDTGAGCHQLMVPEETYSLVRLPQLVSELLDQCYEFIEQRPLIEVFLPLNALNQPVDRWSFGDEEWSVVPVPICSEYHVAVRSPERLTPKYRRNYPTWRERWENFQDITEDVLTPVFASGDCDDLEALTLTLVSQRDIVGLKVAQSVKLPQVFRVILQTAMPVALWLRQDMPGLSHEECHDKIDQLLGCCAREFSARLQEKRTESIKTVNEDHICHHLSLLWEDPYRLPPRPDLIMS
jgi:hypothetical protein